MPQIYASKIIELTHSDKDFAGFKWVLKAVNFEPGPPARAIEICVDGVIATDGHRLHIYSPLETYPAGIFKVFSKRGLVFASTKEVRLPDWRKILPDYSHFKEFRMSDIPERDYVVLIRNIVSRDGLNFRYFNDIDSMDKMYIGPEEGGPIVFEGDRKKALIMPMRM